MNAELIQTLTLFVLGLGGLLNALVMLSHLGSGRDDS